MLAARTLVHPSGVWIVAGVGAAAFLLAAAIVRPGGVGMGDVKLALLLGLPLALVVALAAAAIPSSRLSFGTAPAAGRWAVPLRRFSRSVAWSR